MNKIRIIGIYSGIIGSLYLVYGILEAYSWIFGPVKIFLSPAPDIMGAFILLLIGSVLIYRLGKLLDGRYDGMAFLFVGLVLSAITGIMYLLIMGADALDAAIVGEPWKFDPTSYNLPAIALFILLLPSWILMKHREDFRE